MKHAITAHSQVQRSWSSATKSPLGYVFAIASGLLAVYLRLCLDPLIGHAQLPYAFVFLAVALVAWGVGVPQALVTAILGGVAATALFVLPPGRSLTLGLPQMLALAIYCFVAGMIILLSYQTRRAQHRAETSIALARQKQQELQADVAVRRQVEEALRESEARFRGIFDHAAIPIAIGDLRGQCVLANKAACDFVGLTPSEVIGKGIDDIVYPEDLHLTAHLFPRLISGRIPFYTVVRRYQRKDGLIVWGQASVSLVRDHEGKPKYLIGVMADITERKRIEEALRQSEQHFRTLAEAMPQLVWTSRPDGYCDYYNTQWADYTGIAVSQSLGRCWSQVLHPDERQSAGAQWKQALASGRGFDCETRLRGRDGTYCWFKTRALPLRNEQGQVLKWFGTCTDITDIVQAREALARSREDLERLIRQRTARLHEAVAELEHFSYSITHDMRAPLRAMQSFAILVERESGDRLPARSLDFLRRIMTAADRLDKLIQDSLNYSKIVREKLPLHPVDFPKLLRGMLQSYPNLQPPSAYVEVAIDQLTVLGNESALTQCFSNLLGNAVKFVPPGATPQVRVWAQRCQEQPLLQPALPNPQPAPPPVINHLSPVPGQQPPATGYVRIWVEDNGVGIPQEAQQKIFDMFHRLHRDDQYPGTGIGLAIVRKAVQRIGGLVGLESQPGHGSRFWIELKEVKHA